MKTWIRWLGLESWKWAFSIDLVTRVHMETLHCRNCCLEQETLKGSVFMLALLAHLCSGWKANKCLTLKRFPRNGFVDDAILSNRAQSWACWATAIRGFLYFLNWFPSCITNASQKMVLCEAPELCYSTEHGSNSSIVIKPAIFIQCSSLFFLNNILLQPWKLLQCQLPILLLLQWLSTFVTNGTLTRWWHCQGTPHCWWGLTTLSGPTNECT